MKHLIISAMITAATLSAAAQNLNYAGQFSEPTKTFIYGYDNKKSCEADKGEWQSEEQFCLFDASNEVKVETTEEAFKLSIDTIGANAHSCGFESTAIQKSPNEIMASAEVEVYNFNEETKQNEWVKATCEVTVTYKNSNTVSVSNNGKCQEFCGMRATLDIFEAKRTAPTAE